MCQLENFLKSVPIVGEDVRMDLGVIFVVDCQCVLCMLSSPQVRSERFMFAASNDSLPHSQLAHQEGMYTW